MRYVYQMQAQNRMETGPVHELLESQLFAGDVIMESLLTLE